MEKKPEFKKSLSRRNKPIFIEEETYTYNFIHTIDKGKTELYRCKEYKSIYRCESFIHVQSNTENIIKYKNKHNHFTDHLSVIREETRKEIQNEIKNSRDPFSINIPKLVKSVSVDKGIKAPNFNSIKTTLYTTLNNNLPNDILSLRDAPKFSPYYKTLDEEDFVVYKDSRNLILQSPSLAKIQIEFGTTLFCDSTFFIAPKFAYQVFITRVFSSVTNSYYTTSFSIMSGKTINDYFKIFSEIHKHLQKYNKIGDTYKITELHTDFESSISEGCKKVYPNLKVKNCIWHMLRAIERKKNEICFKDIKNDNNLLMLYNVIKNLYICDPNFITLVFEIIKNKTSNKNFIEFLDYFEEQYMVKWSINNWNYYTDITHCTNNSCEAYNCKLNRMFSAKPSFFKLLYELRMEEKDIINTYKKRKMGLL